MSTTITEGIDTLTRKLVCYISLGHCVVCDPRLCWLTTKPCINFNMNSTNQNHIFLNIKLYQTIKYKYRNQIKSNQIYTLHPYTLYTLPQSYLSCEFDFVFR